MSIPDNGRFVPVIHSIVRPEAILAHTVSSYALREPVTCQLFRSGLNDTYLLTAGSDRYVGRLYHAKRARSEVDYELELLNHLAAKHVPVVVPVRGGDGRLVTSVPAPEGRRLLVVFEYASGTPLSWSEPDHCHLAGRLLAAIHAASDDFASAHARVPLDMDYLIDSPLSAIRPFLADRPNDWSYLEALGTRLKTRVAGVATELDWGVCHGDFGAKNIHIAGATKATVLDFDYSGQGWRAYDFAPVKRASIDQRTNAPWESFLQGYTSVRSLSPKDLQVVMLFRALRHFAMMGVFARNVAEWGSPQVTGPGLDAWLAFFKNWEAEHAETR